MRNISYLALGVLAFGGVAAQRASGQVMFHDDFEDEPVSVSGSPAIGAPLVGTWIEGSGSGSTGADIASSPAIGTRSMRILRESTPPPPSNGQMNGISLDGVIVDDAVFEVKWSLQLTDEGANDHRFNGPSQIAIGHAGSNFNNDLAFILVGDFPTPSGTYHYSNSTTQYAGSTSTTAQPSFGAWDTLRAVFTLNQISATQMGGTYDLFVSLGGGAEQQLANDAVTFTTTIPAVDPTKLQFRVAKGGSSAWTYYDDISVTMVPEPSVAVLGALAGGLLSLRRVRR